MARIEPGDNALIQRAAGDAAYRLVRSLNPGSLTPEQEAMTEPGFWTLPVAERVRLSEGIRRRREAEEERERRMAGIEQRLTASEAQRQSDRRSSDRAAKLAAAALRDANR